MDRIYADARVPARGAPDLRVRPGEHTNLTPPFASREDVRIVLRSTDTLFTTISSRTESYARLCIVRLILVLWWSQSWREAS